MITPTTPPLSAQGTAWAPLWDSAVAAVLVVSGMTGRLLVASRLLDQAVALAADLDDMR